MTILRKKTKSFSLKKVICEPQETRTFSVWEFLKCCFEKYSDLDVFDCGPEGLSFEPFLPWIQKIMITYEAQIDNAEDRLMGQIDTKNHKSFVI
jgi:hypothetical protein